jgi:VWFA-related protein
MRRYYRFALLRVMKISIAARSLLVPTLSFCIASALAQDAPTLPHAPTITVNSRLVVLDVVVMGKDGRPIDGLTRDEVRVFEDKQPQTIRTFEGPADHALPSASADTATVFDPASPKAFGQSPATILVLDQLNTHFADSSFARRELRDYLAAQSALLAQPATLLTVYDNHFKQLQPFTRERDKLLKALAAAPTKNAWKLQTGGNSDTDYGPVERLQQSLNALDQIAESYARIPGRKNLIWVGGGFPTLDPTTLDGEDAREVKDTFRHITDVLLSTRVTLYAVDPTSTAAGLSEITNADQANFATAAGGLSSAIDPFSSTEDFDRLGPVTGGRVVRGLSNVAQLIASSIDLGNHYYTISYTPTGDSSAPGKYRRIHVEALRPGLTVSTREGYYPTTSQSAATVTTDLVYDLSAAAESPIPLNAVHVALQVAEQPETYVLHVSAPDLTWTPNADGSSTAHVAVLAVDLSARNTMLGHILHTMTATARPGTDLRDAAHQADFRFTVPINTKATAIRFIVRDASTGHMGSAETKARLR